MHERRRREAGVPRTARLAVGGPAGETTDFGADHKFSPLERMLLTAAVCTEMPAPPTGRALLLGGGVGHDFRCAGGVPSSVRPLRGLGASCTTAHIDITPPIRARAGAERVHTTPHSLTPQKRSPQVSNAREREREE